MRFANQNGEWETNCVTSLTTDATEGRARTVISFRSFYLVCLSVASSHRVSLTQQFTLRRGSWFSRVKSGGRKRRKTKRTENGVGKRKDEEEEEAINLAQWVRQAGRQAGPGLNGYQIRGEQTRLVGGLGECGRSRQDRFRCASVIGVLQPHVE